MRRARLIKKCIATTFLGLVLLAQSVIPLRANELESPNEDTIEEEQTEWFESHGVVMVGYLENYLPYSATGEDGKATGLVSEMLPLAFDAVMPGNDLCYEYIAYDDYDDMIEALHMGMIEIAFPVSGSDIHNEEDGIAATAPIIGSGMSLVYKGSYNPHVTDVIAVNTRNRLQYYYVIDNYPNAQLLECESIEACLDAVEEGDAGSTILNGLRASSLLKNYTYNNLVSQQLKVSDTRCYGVNAGNDTLLRILNTGFDIVGPDYAQTESYKYADMLYQYTAYDFIKDNFLVIVIVVIVIAVAIIINVAFYARKMKRLSTDRDVYEKEILQSRAELAENIDIISSVGIGIWHIIMEDRKPPRMKANQKMLELLGIEEEMSEEDVYEAWHSRIKIESLDSVGRSVQEMIAGKRSENTYLWVHPTLGEQYVRCGGTAIRIGKKYILRGYHYNVTEEVTHEQKQNIALQEALTEAQQSNRAKTVFLNSMSHDIRTPMNAIIGFAYLALENSSNEELVKDYMEKIATSSNHLLNLINDVLDMSRIESGKIQIKNKNLNLQKTLESLKMMVQTDVDKNELMLKTDIWIKDEFVIADELRLNQILINIISNAIKFTKPNGLIQLKVMQQESQKPGYADYVFTIRDTGIGMSPEFVRHVFEPFTREETATVSGIQGTGLGMAITKNIVDVLGGTIQVRSEVGRGTTFTVILPMMIGTEEEFEQQKEVKRHVDFTGKRMLVVEDNELNQEIASIIFKEMGFEVDLADNGAIAVDTLMKHPADYYSVVMMDIQMPILNGYDATRAIRKIKDPVLSSIPIIATTANAFSEDRDLAIEAGMNDFVAKPIKREPMLVALERNIR